MEQTAKVVYIGKRVTSKGKLAPFYATVTGETVDMLNAFSFKKPLGKFHSVGQLYEIIQNEDGATYTGGTKAPKLLGIWPNAKDTEEWTLKSSAAEVQHAAEAKQRSTKAHSYRDTLKGIRTEYHAAIGNARRAAILAAVIEAVISRTAVDD